MPIYLTRKATRIPILLLLRVFLQKFSALSRADSAFSRESSRDRHSQAEPALPGNERTKVVLVPGGDLVYVAREFIPWLLRVKWIVLHAFGNLLRLPY